MTKASQETIYKLSVLSGYSIETVTEVFESLIIYATLQNLEGQPFIVPNIGEVSVEYKGDATDKNGKHALIDVNVDPDAYLSRCIGQIHDGVITDAEIRMRELNEKYLEKIVES
jgi:hypothetical protein